MTPMEVGKSFDKPFNSHAKCAICLNDLMSKTQTLRNLGPVQVCGAPHTAEQAGESCQAQLGLRCQTGCTFCAAIP